MARRRRHHPMRNFLIIATLCLGGFAWWMGWFDGGEPETQIAEEQTNSNALLVAESSNSLLKPPTDSMPIQDPDSADSTPRPDGTSAVQEAESISLMKRGKKALEQGNTIEARTLISKAYSQGLPEHLQAEARDRLNQIGETTIFSQRAEKADTLVEFYTIKSGDNLAKIAKSYNITPELIAKINGIKNPNHIRAGQRIKVVKGPFHARVSKSTFEMDILLGNTLVKTFGVGLGQDDGTPMGEWKIRNKLKHPTYYPPRGGRIIAADDPTNPLGDRWMGLEGISGEALGQERYGIHGTIDPDSIGKAVSMGCVRMLNSDVSQVFDLLVVGHSHVWTVE